MLLQICMTLLQNAKDDFENASIFFFLPKVKVVQLCFGAHWLSLFGQQQLNHSSKYFLLRVSHIGLKQHEVE